MKLVAREKGESTGHSTEWTSPQGVPAHTMLAGYDIVSRAREREVSGDVAEDGGCRCRGRNFGVSRRTSGTELDRKSKLSIMSLDLGQGILSGINHPGDNGGTTGERTVDGRGLEREQQSFNEGGLR